MYAALVEPIKYLLGFSDIESDQRRVIFKISLTHHVVKEKLVAVRNVLRFLVRGIRDRKYAFGNGAGSSDDRFFFQYQNVLQSAFSGPVGSGQPCGSGADDHEIHSNSLRGRVCVGQTEAKEDTRDQKIPSIHGKETRKGLRRGFYPQRKSPGRYETGRGI